MQDQPITIMYQTAFPDAECKLYNSMLHLGRFDHVAKCHLARLRPQVSLVHEPDGTSWIDVGFPDQPMLPRDIPLSLGDAVHNIRAALDFAISDICLVANPSEPRSHRVSFPFEGSKNLLHTKLTALMRKDRLPKDVAELIENDFCPWGSQTDRSGNHVLWSLSKLDNDDKHKLLTPAIHVTTLSGVNCRAVYENGGFMDFQGATIVLRNDKTSTLAGLGPAKLSRLDVGDCKQVNGEARFHGNYFTGEPVIPVLSRLRNMVLGILHSLTPHMDALRQRAEQNCEGSPDFSS